MRSTAIQVTSALRRHVGWLVLCLYLLIAASTYVPAPSPVTPTAGGPTQAATSTTYHGYTNTVFAVAWSPDGMCIASGGNDSTVQVLDVSTGQRGVAYTGHTGSIYTVVWSSDGRRIASEALLR